MDDSTAMRELANGNRSAFDAIVNRHWKHICNYVKKFLDESTAEEVTQDSFMALLVNVNKFDQGQSIIPWLRRIAKNKAIDRLRRKKHRLVLNDCSELARLCYYQENRLEITESVIEVNRALRKIAPIYRDVLVLYYYGDFDYNGIAARLNIPLGTVKSRMVTGREQLARLLS